MDSNQHEIRNILLLDNDIELADTLKQLLELRNYLVTTVSNGVEGLREVMEFDFDVILCDLMMPQMPGDMFYLAVKKVKPEMAKRFIFITGHGDDPKIRIFLSQAEGIVLRKPILSEDLIQAISFIISEHG